jgi:hypothetical protein
MRHQQHLDCCPHYRTDCACGLALSPHCGELVFFDDFGGVPLMLQTLKVRTLRIDSCRTLSAKR